MPSQLARLHNQRRELRQRISKLSASYAAANAEVNTQAAGLRSTADAAAADMRSAFSSASAAYAAYDGAAAAGFAAQGRAAQSLARSLNAQVGALFDGLVEERASLDQARAELQQLNERIRQAEAVIKKLRRPTYTPVVRAVQLKGFSLARGVDERMVRQILAELAPKLVGQIGGITYINEFGHGGAVGRNTAKPNNPLPDQIYLYDMMDWELDVRQEEYRNTVVHEAGHSLFSHLTTGAQRFEWGKLFNAMLSSGGVFITPYASSGLQEDFAESFMKYRLDSDKLYKEYRERYDFIDRLYKEISE